MYITLLHIWVYLDLSPPRISNKRNFISPLSTKFLSNNILTRCEDYHGGDRENVYKYLYWEERIKNNYSYISHILHILVKCWILIQFQSMCQERCTKSFKSKIPFKKDLFKLWKYLWSFRQNLQIITTNSRKNYL